MNDYNVSAGQASDSLDTSISKINGAFFVCMLGCCALYAPSARGVDKMGLFVLQQHISIFNRTQRAF